MSLSNYQSTVGCFTGTTNPISGDSITRRDIDGFGEAAGNEASGTGAVKKTKNALKKNNKDRGYKQENFNKSKFHNPNKRKNGNQTVSHDVESMSYNNSNPHDKRTYQKNTYPEYRFNSFDNMNSNSARNSRYYHEGTSHEYSIDLMSHRNGKYDENSSTRYLGYEDISRSNVEILRENSPDSNKNGKFRNGKNLNFQKYYGDVHQDYSNTRKFNRNARYKNDKDRNYLYFNEDTSQEKKVDGRNAEYYQRKQRNIGKNNGKIYNNRKKFQKKVEIASQRERLEEMIKHRTLECLVCCELLKHNNEVWSCKQCYHILHLKCTQAWAKSSKIENGWRCPACQNVCKEIPAEYLCFCGKQKNPRNEPGTIAHSCGEICLRQRRNCDHNCLILCHPGPCPDCTILVDKSCGCGKSKQQVMCSSEVEIICDSLCEKCLECGVHKCYEKCHMGDCKPCEKILHQTCFCEKSNRDVTCSFEYQGSRYYSCGDVCGKKLKCKNHKCQDVCHGGVCKPCKKDCSLIKTCYCGRNPLEIPRISCLDPIPSCDSLCQKILNCGPNGNRHKCESVCHDGECPPCSFSTILKCRCGSMNREIPCQKLVDDDARCEKKCTKKRLCGKHKCNQRCCIEIEHICPLPCNRTLSCGNHRCELTCHNGRCKPCMESSFEELYCECGSEVMYPPIPCGTRPPVCDKPCSRPRECGHEVNHACHTGPCPPCTILCKRWCYGKHELRGAIPCHQEEFSCGLPCGNPMPCGRHKCNSPCHSGACPMPCKQPCIFERSVCGHACNAPCHELPCPQTSCKSKVTVACICGVQKGFRSCNDVTNEMRNIELARLSEKMMSMSKNKPVDISDMSKPERPKVLKILECTEECHVMERNRRLAIGLQIRNPDISQKLTPRYSDFMKGWAKKDPHFCRRIYEKLTELVKLAKQSQQKCRSHSFESMNRDKRQFIHEYCEHFGCESEAYDAEPNRNVVATAIRDKSWLPSMSLLEVIQRENGQRKVPMPSHLERNLCSKSESVALKPLSRTIRLGVSQIDADYSKSSI